jgi:pyrroloquinoline quinone biosynthesis protein B
LPFVVILGTAQDGGVPHAGCLCRNCAAARRDHNLRHPPVSIGVVSDDEAVLIDPTLAFEEQMHALWTCLPSSSNHAEERFQPPGTIVITHTHTGHYAGLWQLDRSVLAANHVQVIGPRLTIDMLSANEPWKTMQAEGYVDFTPLAFDAPLSILTGVEMELIQVPHRSEWATDTAAVVIDGPARRVLYLPDIDSWEEWHRDLVETVESFDVVLLDGCFWQAPNRKGVPHPPVTQTMDLLQHVAISGQTAIGFTHLNHSNPVLTPGSDERKMVVERGFFVAAEGDRIEI